MTFYPFFYYDLDMMVEVAGEIGISEVQKAAAEPKAPEQTTASVEQSREVSATNWLGKLTRLIRKNHASVETPKPEVPVMPTVQEIRVRPRTQSEIFADEDAAKRAKLAADEMEQFREDVAHPASRGRGVERYFSGISLGVMKEAQKADKNGGNVRGEEAQPRITLPGFAELEVATRIQAEKTRAKIVAEGERQIREQQARADRIAKAARKDDRF